MNATFSTITTAAQFCAELVKQGLTFSLREVRGEFIVTMTGGF